VPSADFENQPVETYDDELLKLALEGRDGRFVLSAGSYRFEVIAFNASGNGPAALSTVFQPR
jgi:hypothetical protein